MIDYPYERCELRRHSDYPARAGNVLSLSSRYIVMTKKLYKPSFLSDALVAAGPPAAWPSGTTVQARELSSASENSIVFRIAALPLPPQAHEAPNGELRAHPGVEGPVV